MRVDHTFLNTNWSRLSEQIKFLGIYWSRSILAKGHTSKLLNQEATHIHCLMRPTCILTQVLLYTYKNPFLSIMFALIFDPWQQLSYWYSIYFPIKIIYKAVTLYIKKNQFCQWCLHHQFIIFVHSYMASSIPV